jgi:hypothetical protein
MFKRDTSGIGMTGKLWLGAASLGLASTVAVAAGPDQGTGGASFVRDSRPVATSVGTDNATPGTYRALIADGSSLHQAWAGDSVKWYAVLIEPGKTYVVDAFDPYTDYIDGSVSGLGIYASDGTTTPPAETQVNCAANVAAPGLANFGKRCIIRAYTSNPGNTLNSRLVYIRVARWIDTAFQIRVRESTVYGRWTTNGYDFHVEVQNTTAESVCAQVMFYPNSGMAYTAGAWTGPALTAFANLTIPPFGASKYVLPNGTLVGTDNRGSLRIGACPTPVNLNTAAVHVNTLGFNPLINQFLPYSTIQPNGGNGNSF